MRPTRLRITPDLVTRVALLVAVLLLVPGLAGCLSSDQPVTSTKAGNEQPTDLWTSPDRSSTKTYDTSGNWSRVLETGDRQIGDYVYQELDSDVDGSPIEIGIQLPVREIDEAFPVLVLASEKFDKPLASGPPGPDSHPRSDHMVENFVPHGYAVAFVNTMGDSDPGTCRDPFGSPAVASDIEQALTWLGEASWSTGDLGMIGFSSEAVNAWIGAARDVRSLETIVPIAGSADLFHVIVHNGTYNPGNVAGPLLLPTLSHTEQAPLACPETVEAVAAAGEVMGTSEPDHRGYWEDRDRRDDVLSSYDGSVFLIHGLRDPVMWPDNADPWMDRVERSGIPLKIWLGQWGHEYPDELDPEPGEQPEHFRADFAQVLLDWFDHWLKEDETRALGPRVQVADTQGAWRNGSNWPPADTQRLVLHPDPDGSLAREPADTGRAVLATGPNDLATGTPAAREDIACSACRAFETDPLDETLRFAGRPHLKAQVVPTSPRAHLTAHLLVQGGEDQRILTGGQIDLRFADGDRQADPLVPGEPVDVRLDLQPVDGVVPKGGRLMLELSQGFYTHPGPEDAGPAQFPGSTQYSSAGSGPVEVALGDGRTTITLQTFDVPEEAFFEPPGVESSSAGTATASDSAKEKSENRLPLDTNHPPQ